VDEHEGISKENANKTYMIISSEGFEIEKQETCTKISCTNYHCTFD